MSADPRSSTRFLGPALTILGLFLLGAHLSYFVGATCDDAFISLRYARNFLEGRGLVFNPGERVEGYSNFLWVVLLAGLGALGADPLVAAKALGLASLVAWLFLVLRIIRAAGWGATERGGLVLLLGSIWPVAYYALSGLETVFYAALLAAAGWTMVRDHGRLGPATAIWLLAAALTRPEGIVFVGLFGAVHVVRRREVRTLVAPAVIFTIGYGAFLAWRFAYYGTWVPNTYLVKSPMREGLGPGWVRLLIGGLDEVVAFVEQNGGAAFVVLAGLGAALSRSLTTAVAATLFAGGLFFVKFAGGDWMPGYRFLVPFVPFYLVLAIDGLRQIRARVAASARTTEWLTAAFLLVVAALGLRGSVEFHLDRGRYPYFVMTSEDMISAARRIATRYPAGTEIVSWRIGALAYYSDLVVIDTWGLTDARIARLRYEGQASEEALGAYLEERAPRLVLSADRLEPGAEKTFGKLRYGVVEVFPQGTNSVWTLFERVDE